MIDRIACTNFRRIKSCDIPLKDGITVLIGNNGSGKSTVVEAAIFALYGKTRDKTSIATIRRKSAADDELTSAAVYFTVGGIHYRAVRWLTKSGSTKAKLTMYTDNEWETLMDNPITFAGNDKFGTTVSDSSKGVTESVTETININDKGFLASFIAQQKELDSFAALGGVDRKKFFVDLLGYGVLDKMKKSLGSKANEKKSFIDALKKPNQSIDEIKHDIKTYEERIKVLEGRIEKGRQLTEKAKEDSAAAAEEYNRASTASTRVEMANTVIAECERQERELQTTIDTLTKSIAENKKRSKGYDENASVVQRHTEKTTAYNNALSYNTAYNKWQETVGALERLAQDIVEKEKALAKAEEKIKEQPDITTPQEELNKIRLEEDKLTQRKEDRESKKRQTESLISLVNSGELVNCPTCGTPMATEQGRGHLDNEISFLDEEIAGYNAQLVEWKKKHDVAQDALDVAKMKTMTFDMDKKKADDLRSDLRSSRTLLSAQQVQADSEKKRVDELEPYKLTRSQLFKVNEEAIELAHMLDKENEMKRAFYAVQRDETALTQTQDQLTTAKHTHETNKDTVVQNNKLAASLAKCKEKADKARANYEKYSDALVGLQSELSANKVYLESANNNLKIAQEYAKDLQQRLKEQAIIVGAQEVVGHLLDALPQKIAPSIADRASVLLDAATNGRYSLLEISDTYSISVYTDDDIRPIEQMSGGESDVIFLSVRIAIAQLMLASAGVPEQSFILDEIFGALDDERRESTCAALRGICGDDSKLLCITHIDEIKDMADWTYVMEMDENGASSSRQVIENKAQIA